MMVYIGSTIPSWFLTLELGAYGSGCSFVSMIGTFSEWTWIGFSSLEDPPLILHRGFKNRAIGDSKKKKKNNNSNNHADNNNRFFVHFALAMCCYTAVWGVTHDGHEAGCDNWSFPFQWRYHNSWVEDLGVSVLGHLQVVFSIQSQSVPYPEIGKKKLNLHLLGKKGSWAPWLVSQKCLCWSLCTYSIYNTIQSYTNAYL